MRIGSFIISLSKAGLTVSRQKASGAELITQWPSPTGWLSSVIRGEPFSGAWQRGIRVSVDDAATHPTFWACITLIAGDIAKTRPRLIVEDGDGICTETDNAAYSPIIRKPNRYQNRIQFYMYWVLSKLTRGNAYALKERDNRGVVKALYLLDPTRVKPLVTPSGDVYYALQQDVLSGVTEASVVVPATEIIHDLWYALYHPLVGLSPVYACGHAALQGIKAIHNSSEFFENGSQLGGILSAPEAISDVVAKRIQEHWENNYAGPRNAGRVAVLGNGLKFEKPPVMSAVDAQLVEQLKWGDEKICAVFHVPPHLVGVGGMPTYNNVEALNQQYYSQCLQILFESLELCLTEGLELKTSYEVEFDLAGLLRMDSTQKMDAATKGVVGGVYSPNEARRQFNLKPVTGGDTPYLQQQNYSLAALDRRDSAAPAPASTTATQTNANEQMPQRGSAADIVKGFRDGMARKAA
jgi:HK97 family phage portal protein